MAAPIVSIIGESNSGKTTLIEKLIPELKRRGYRVGILKHHACSEFEVDVPGKDTWRHARAGAEAVAMISPRKFFLVRTTEGEMSLRDAASLLGDVDLVLTEGFRWETAPKVKVIRATNSPAMSHGFDECLAVVTDLPISAPVPVLGLEEIVRLADLIEERFLG